MLNGNAAVYGNNNFLPDKQL